MESRLGRRETGGWIVLGGDPPPPKPILTQPRRTWINIAPPLTNQSKHVSISGMRMNKHPCRRRHGSKSRLPATRIYIKMLKLGIYEVEVTVVLWWKMWKCVFNKSKIRTWTFISIFERLQTRWLEWVTDVPMSSSNKSFQPNEGVNNTLIYEFGLVYPHSSSLDASFRSTHSLLAPSRSCMQ